MNAPLQDEVKVSTSENDQNAIKETRYLTSTPNNAKRLRRVIEDLNRSDGEAESPRPSNACVY